jgi:hypothetical protein
VAPLSTAGPLTAKEMGRPEVDVAERAIGATPYVTDELTGAKLIVCVAWFTVRDTEALAVV